MWGEWNDFEHMYEFDLNSRTRCSHCGRRYYGEGCRHLTTEVDDMSDDEAERVRARYAFGELHNPDHNLTSYRDEKKNAVDNPTDPAS